MRVSLRISLLTIAMIGVSLSLAIRARRAADAVEYAGDSNSQTIEQAEAAFPFAITWVGCLGLTILIWRRWKRVDPNSL